MVSIVDSSVFSFMSLKNFTETFLLQIQPGWLVLDLGAGDGHFTRMFADQNARVIAVDPKFSGIENKNITIFRMRLEDFIKQNSTTKYDAVFMRNVLQFLDRNWVMKTLIPWLDENVMSQGVVGIETFYQNPIPSFDQSVSSLFTVRELLENFQGWQTLLKDQHEHFSPDLQGNKREFFTSDLIVKKLK